MSNTSLANIPAQRATPIYPVPRRAARPVASQPCASQPCASQHITVKNYSRECVGPDCTTLFTSTTSVMYVRGLGALCVACFVEIKLGTRHPNNGDD